MASPQPLVSNGDTVDANCGGLAPSSSSTSHAVNGSDAEGRCPTSPVPSQQLGPDSNVPASESPARLGGDQAMTDDELDEQEAVRRHWRNVRVCLWISFMSTVTTQMAAGTFLDIYIFQVSGGSNSAVGAVESARGIAQLLAAPFLGLLADRFNRYRLYRVQALTRVVPFAVLAYAVTTDRYTLLYVALPVLAVSNHLGITLRGALLADNVVEGPARLRWMSQNHSATYLGNAVAPLLQLAVMLGLGLDGDWSLPLLRQTLLAGCASFLLAEPAVLFFLSVQPYASGDPGATGTAGSGQARSTAVAETRLAEGRQPNAGDLEAPLAAPKSWKEQTVLRCCYGGEGVRKMWAIPILVEATFIVVILGSALTVKFFPLYFKSEFGFSPLSLCLLGVAEPLGVVVLSQANPRVTRWLGQAPTAALYMALAPLFLLVVTLGTSPWLVAPCFVLRTATGRAYIPIYMSIVATCVPVEHRGKFAALSAFRMSFFSASAFVGGWMADLWHSYRPSFLLTAAWQVFPSLVMFLPVIAWMPRSDVHA